MSNEREEDVFMTIRMPKRLHAELSTLAEVNERTTAGEIRLALYRHLEREHLARVAESKR